MKNLARGRFLIDYDNPDAGIGHSLGHVNNAVKLCMRHSLDFAYSDKQVIKSTRSDLKWRLRQFSRTIVGRKAHETHGIGDSIARMFAFSQYTMDRERIEDLIRKKLLKLIEIPGPDIAIPSNAQDDDVAYAQVDAVVRANPEDGVVFVLPRNRTGDFEYGTTREWFRRCYLDAGSYRVKSKVESGERSLTVAMHIRRGDLLPGRQFADLSHRMLADSWYASVIESLAKVSQCKLKIVILSEGVGGKYLSELGLPFSWATALSHLDCEVTEMIDNDFGQSFHEMVQANVLIGSKSGMTHLAGLMSDGLKLVPKMWHSYRGTPHVLELEQDLNSTDLEAGLAVIWHSMFPENGIGEY